MKTSVENATILIADDSEILNNMLKDVFEENGFEVVQAFDGEECRSIFLRKHPDLAFVDIHMPKIDGIEMLRYIKERDRRTLVVMMTGVGSEQTAVRAMKLGADDYLTKPFGIDEVVALATKLLERRQAADENVRLKKEIHRAERYLAHLATIINEAIITTDQQGRIQFTNRAVSDLWGYSSDELKDQDIHFLIRGQARTLLSRDIVKETIREGKLEGEFHFRKKDKGTFPGYLSSSVIKEKGQVRGIVTVVADLTRLYEVERRLKQSEKLAALGKVVEGIAHEVRNSLTSLGGFALRLRKITTGDPQCAQYTGIILDDVSRLEKMVADIEEYVRFSKFYTFRYEKTDLLPVVESARDRAVRELPSRLVERVSFSLVADENLPHVLADSVAIEEVFFNLILNAYEAMPRGGRVKATLRNINSAVSVAFTDTGAGIRDEDLTDIFNPFFTSKTTGAGMGLSKAYLLVEEHRGAINVRSEPGKGTTVEVLLPVDRLMTGLFSWETESHGGPFR
ncbi:MAG: response regulator [Desulfomonile tiedjei]|nr:response regulator [Desulfomonile tiedjei]